MKAKIIILILMIELISANLCISSHPDDIYWRYFESDKQVWEFGPVNKIVVNNQNKMFASGWFDMIPFDSLYFNCIAELIDSAWMPLGSGLNAGIKGFFPIINDMLLSDSSLYVAGLFDTAGTVKANNIAKWNINSRTWSSLGKGTNGIITSIAKVDNKIFIGGRFDTLFNNNNSINTKNIGYWDGTNWNSIGGVNNVVTDMFVSNQLVYIVGEFDTVGYQPSKNIAIWKSNSPTQWFTVGNVGPIGEVSKVCRVGNNTYFAGIFDSVYTGSTKIYSKNIVKWTGSNWSALADGLNGRVFQMVTDESNLYAVGSFTKVLNDSNQCKGIAKWNGTEWSIFGRGADQTIRTIALHGDSILVGGDFVFTGDSLAENIGLWYKETGQVPPPGINGESINSIENGIVYGIAINLYPNPTENEATIEFFIQEKGIAEIVIYDASGAINEVVTNKEYEAGWHKVLVKCDNYSSGIYICKLTFGNKTISNRLILIK